MPTESTIICGSRRSVKQGIIKGKVLRFCSHNGKSGLEGDVCVCRRGRLCPDLTGRTMILATMGFVRWMRSLRTIRDHFWEMHRFCPFIRLRACMAK